MDREIKVTKCGDKSGCLFSDRVSIEFCPSELETLGVIFEQRALNATRYNEQGNERAASDLFTKAYKMWGKEREEKDK